MNREQIKSLLLCNNRAVERAMIALYNRQTVDEQHTSTTHQNNGRGFNAYHAKHGTYYAKWVLSGKHLTGSHLDRARKMACHYVGQLVQISEASSPVVITHTPCQDTLCSLITHHDPFQSATV